MNFDTFERIVKKVKASQPLLFELEHDNIPSMAQVDAFQTQYQIQLPEKYIQFLLNYGGGYFGYAIIYSLDQNSYFYLANHNQEGCNQYLFFADNECGDAYAFCIENGKCDDAVISYHHDEKNFSRTEFSDVLEYLVKMGLKELF